MTAEERANEAAEQDEALELDDLAPWLDRIDKVLAMAQDGLLDEQEREAALLEAKELFDSLFDRLEVLAQSNAKLIAQLRALIALLRIFGGNLV